MDRKPIGLSLRDVTLLCCPAALQMKQQRPVDNSGFCAEFAEMVRKLTMRRVREDVSWAGGTACPLTERVNSLQPHCRHFFGDLIAISRHNQQPLFPDGEPRAVDYLEMRSLMTEMDPVDGAVEIWPADLVVDSETLDWDLLRFRAGIAALAAGQRYMAPAVRVVGFMLRGGFIEQAYEWRPTEEERLRAWGQLEQQFQVYDELLERYGNQPWPYNPNAQACGICDEACELQRRLVSLSGGLT